VQPRFLTGLIFVFFLVVSALSSPAFGQPVSSTLVKDKIQAACLFLQNLYNPALGLVRSTANNTVYYIASDNILAARALTACNTTKSQQISQNITLTISRCCGNGYDHKHEILLGSRISLPIHEPHTYTIANSTSPNYSILWEFDNETTIPPDCTYADITVYTALELNLEKNATGTQHEMDCLNLMFDGKGLADEAYKNINAPEHGIYQTYKLALYYYALRNVSNTYYYSGETSDILRMQGPDGGFHTGYDQIGTYAGTQENAETTSIIMIAISNLSTTNPFTFFSIPSWVAYFFIAWAATGAGVVVIVLLSEWKQKQSLQSKQ
jgi:hypothetical protein